MNFRPRMYLTGFIGNDPSLSTTQNGKVVLKFSVATHNNRAGGNGSENRKTIWMYASVWGDRANALAGILAKGQRVVVEADLIDARVWTRKDGTPDIAIDIAVNTIFPLATQNAQSAPAAQPVASQPAAPQPAPKGVPPVDPAPVATAPTGFYPPDEDAPF